MGKRGGGRPVGLAGWCADEARMKGSPPVDVNVAASGVTFLVNCDGLVPRLAILYLELSLPKDPDSRMGQQPIILWDHEIIAKRLLCNMHWSCLRSFVQDCRQTDKLPSCERDPR